MDVQTIPELTRSAFRALFGSRLTAHLEDELFRTRSDYETRLLERERVISDLREQLAILTAKVDRYELVLIPLTSPAGSLLGQRPSRPPTFEASSEPRPQTWAEVQAEYYARQAEEDHGDNQGREAQVK